MSTAAIILAAGFSSRLGRPKQTLILNGETLVERAARLASEAGFSPVIVVVNREADFCEPLENRACIVAMNEQAVEGMASSIRRGITVAKSFHASGAVLLTCDQIALDIPHLCRLVEDPTRIIGSRYAGHNGIPAYFPDAAFDDLLQLRGDIGARHLLHAAQSIVNESLSIDIDTEADLTKLIQQ